MGIDLKDRTVVVTGAAAGVGLGIAEAYARAGAKTALLDIRGEELEAQAARLKDEGLVVGGFRLDITDRDAVMKTFRRIRNDFGPVFALVNNAGIVDQRPFTEITSEQMDRMMRVHVNGTLYCMQAASVDMVETGEGRIISMSSKSGKTGSALMAHYSAAKGAVIALTHAVAFELAPHNIMVNCLCPGIIDNTGVWNQVSSGYTKNLGLSEEEVVQQFTAKVPLKRLARIEDIVDFVMFLTVSGEYCTGQAFNISGGREVH
jgi:NAD(P)-dependent dehydrogenase (short-subunit alcohol dehydrogenase family)